MKVRQVLAPVLLSYAFSAIESKAPTPNSKLTLSNSNIFSYCFTREFLGSVKTLTKDFLSISSSEAMTGNLRRFPVIASLDEIDKKSLVRVLTEPKNSLVKQYEKIFELDNVSLEFGVGALDSIAEKAYESKTGASTCLTFICLFSY